MPGGTQSSERDEIVMNTNMTVWLLRLDIHTQL